MVVIFLDELTTVPPTTQAAMLRLLTENVCGEIPLPDYEPGKGGVVYLCASNAVEWAAGGQEIQPPMANRLWHGEFPMDHETWCDMMVSDFPAPTDLPVVPADYLREHHHRQRAMIAAYVRASGHDAWLAPPDDPARRSGPWASGRTWYLASRFLAAIESVSPGNRLPPGSGAGRARRRSGAAVPRVPRGIEPAGSRRDPAGPAQLRAARSRGSRLCRVLRARGRRPQQQDAGAVGGGHDRARAPPAGRTRTSRRRRRARSATRRTVPRV